MLAGGQSRRFGSDKALAKLGGATLLGRICASLAGSPRRIVLAPPARYSGQLPPGWALQSEPAAGEGPLNALAAALAWAEAAGGGWTAICGADYPLVSQELWAALYACAQRQPPGTLAVGLRGGNGPEPMPALYCSAAAPIVAGWVTGGERRLRRALSLPGSWLSPAELGLSRCVLADADTPEALRRLSEHLPGKL